MAEIRPIPTGGTDGVHGETKKRDPNFIMSGHHCHTYCELFYVHSGCCRFLADDRFYDLHAGDFIMIPPWGLHYTRYLSGECVRTVVLYRREDVSEDVLGCLRSPDTFFSETILFQVPEAYRTRIEDCLRQLVSEERISDPCSGPMRRSLLQTLLLLCCRFCEALPHEDVSEIHTTDPEILRAARYITQNYARPLTTGDVARAVGFSPNYLSRRFRQAAGIGLHEYLVFIRLHHAARELISTTDSITTIALRCGFSDSNYFKDSFKKKYGVTPRSYRKQ